MWSAAGCRDLAGYGKGEVVSDARADQQLQADAKGAPPDGPTGDRGGLPDLLEPCAKTAETPLLHLDFEEHPLVNRGSVTGVALSLKDGAVVKAAEHCDQALVLTSAASESAHLHISDHPELRLSKGLIDLWIRFDREAAKVGDYEGILSRDAKGQDQDGHFTLLRTSSGLIIARLQQNASTGGAVGYSCVREPADAKGRWLHIRVAFGGGKPLQIYLGEGGAAAEPSKEYPWLCGEGKDLVQGLEGNALPWALGASLDKFSPDEPFAQNRLVGAIDELRLYGSRGKL